MLNNSPVCPTLPVTDIEKAKTFYEQTLGLHPSGKSMPDGVLYDAGDNSKLYIYQRGPSKADHTLASFSVTNIEKTIGELTEKGVKFEQYNIPDGLVTNEKGIATMGNIKAAWFKDPDGNILALTQIPT